MQTIRYVTSTAAGAEEEGLDGGVMLGDGGYGTRLNVCPCGVIECVSDIALFPMDSADGMLFCTIDLMQKQDGMCDDEMDW